MFELYYFSTASGREPVKEFLLALDKKSRDAVLEVFEHFKEHSFHLPDKYLRRIRGGEALWELRTKSRGRQLRIFLAKYRVNSVVLLHGIIKKTQKTPRKDIEVAEQRFRTLLKN